MNKYIVTSLIEVGLQFTSIQSAQSYANEHGLSVCQVYYLDEHTPKFIGYSVENENELVKPIASA